MIKGQFIKKNMPMYFLKLLTHFTLFIYFLNIYLFIFGCVGPLLLHVGFL